MVWKQDLAKLKKELQETEGIKPKGPVPKVAPKPEKFLDIQEEDALFLMVMGKKPAQNKASMAIANQETIVTGNPGDLTDALTKDQAPAKANEKAREKGAEKVAEKPIENGVDPVPEDFHTAMQSLKGLKPAKRRQIVDSPVSSSPLTNAQPDRTPSTAKAEAAMVSADTTVEPPCVLEKKSTMDVAAAGKKALRENSLPGEITLKVQREESTPKIKSEPHAPELIHLAAGMAVDVDGHMDLRGHSTVDAMERLRERVQDGIFLGWRTFHITLGPDTELREAFLNYLKSEEAMVLTRYAQAPIPMGGVQAWILYYPNH